MADKAWYDRPLGNTGLSAREIGTGVAIVGIPAAAGGVVTGVLEKVRDTDWSKSAKPKGVRRQSASRYNDGGTPTSPRTKARLARQQLAAGSADAETATHHKRMKSAAKATATRVKRGQIEPFQATRVGGKFATKGTKLLAQAGKVAGTVGKVAGIVGAATTIGALGIVGYDLVTGKHAGDREDAMRRENDPGRVAATGIAGTATTSLASRVIGGVAARTAGGMLARAAGPIGLGAVAAYGAYKGYADEGAKGAVRGAVSQLTFGLADKAMDKVLGPKKVDTIGPMLKQHWPIRSEGFNQANVRHAAGNHDPNDHQDYKNTWSDTRGRNYTRRDLSVRTRNA